MRRSELAGESPRGRSPDRESVGGRCRRVVRRKQSAEPPEEGQGTLVSTPFDSFASYGSDGRGLPPCQLRLRQVPGQESGLARVLVGLINHAQPHTQLAHLQVGDEAVRRKADGGAKLVD